MNSRRSMRMHGWRLFTLVAAGLAAMTLGIILVEGLTEPGVRMVVRATARTSAILFLTAFAAPGVVVLAPRPIGSWLARECRFLLLGFGLSHSIHLAALVTWANLFPESFFARFQPATGIVGGILYMFIALLCIRALRPAIDNPRWLRSLETVGLYLLWSAFALAYLTNIFSGAVNAVFGLVTLIALGVRVGPKLLRSSATAGPGS